MSEDGLSEAHPCRDEHGLTETPSTPTDIVKAELEEKQFKVKLNVVDTPGFGDYVNNRDSWNPIVDFIVRLAERTRSEAAKDVS